MTMNTPDLWVVVTITTATESIDKVFAGWYGGFVGSDSWQLSSGIVETEQHDDCLIFVNRSGSRYRCYKSAHGISGYMRTVLENWLADSDVKVHIHDKF